MRGAQGLAVRALLGVGSGFRRVVLAGSKWGSCYFIRSCKFCVAYGAFQVFQGLGPWVLRFTIRKHGVAGLARFRV